MTKEVPFLVRDLKKLSYGGQLVEIACPNNYYFGRVRNIPKELLNLEICYICAGKSDTDGTPNTLLVDVYIPNK